MQRPILIVAGLVFCITTAVMAAPASAPRVLTPEEMRTIEIVIPDLEGEAGARAEIFFARQDALSAEPDAPAPDLGTLPGQEQVLAYLDHARAAGDPRVRELFVRVARDQNARLAMSDAALFEGLSAEDAAALRNGVIALAMLLEDRANTAWMKRQVAEIGWFRIAEYGAAADDAAWLLVQHADLEIEFQQQVLATLETLWREGETNPRNFAYLHDRVAMKTGALSRYGTQGDCNRETGLWAPFEMEDGLDAVNARRAEVGLDPLVPVLENTRQMCANFLNR